MIYFFAVLHLCFQLSFPNTLGVEGLEQKPPESEWWQIGHWFTHWPNSWIFRRPTEDLQFTDISFPSTDGTKLMGRLFLTKEEQSRGTVLFFHGNMGNISAHFSLTSWLNYSGYDVFVFDYRAFGKSQGDSDPEGFYKDALAALEFTRTELSGGSFYAVGHSLGGIILGRALADYPHKEAVNLLVLMSTFSSYRERAEDNVWRWLAIFSMSEAFDFDTRAEDLKSIPLLVIHGTEDQTVVSAHGKKIFETSLSLEKQYWGIQGATHMNLFWREFENLDFLNSKERIAFVKKHRDLVEKEGAGFSLRVLLSDVGKLRFFQIRDKSQYSPVMKKFSDHLDRFQSKAQSQEWRKKWLSSLTVRSEVTPEEFSSLNQKLKKTYEENVKKYGSFLSLPPEMKISEQWRLDGLYLQSQWNEIHDYVSLGVSGGVAKETFMTKDSYALAVCSSLGFLMGGFPKQSEDSYRSFMGNHHGAAGQADYFATARCLPILFADDDNAAIVESLPRNPWINQKCASVYPDQKSYDICVRSLHASLAFSKMFSTVRFFHDPLPRFETPSSRVVSETKMEMLDPQCRLDTLTAGALCSRAKSEQMEMPSSKWRDQACVREKGDVIGVRPLCWYSPN